MSEETKKLFLTSWPSGELRPVEILGKHPSIKGGIYIRYEQGGTDTTTDNFLFDVPESIASQKEQIEALQEAIFAAVEKTERPARKWVEITEKLISLLTPAQQEVLK